MQLHHKLPRLLGAQCFFCDLEYFPDSLRVTFVDAPPSDRLLGVPPAPAPAPALASKTYGRIGLLLDRFKSKIHKYILEDLPQMS